MHERSEFRLFIVQAGLGVALALSQPTWYALYDKFSGSGLQDGYVWGLAAGWGYIVSGIALVVGGLVITFFSFTALFVTMGMVQTIATIYQATILKYKTV